MKINMFEKEEFLEVVKDGIGKGPLTLIIACSKCYEQFELDKSSISMAILTGASLVEYIRYVQNSKCPSCGVQN